MVPEMQDSIDGSHNRKKKASAIMSVIAVFPGSLARRAVPSRIWRMTLTRMGLTWPDGVLLCCRQKGEFSDLQGMFYKLRAFSDEAI
jgi:hypothetical protein